MQTWTLFGAVLLGPWQRSEGVAPVPGCRPAVRGLGGEADRGGGGWAERGCYPAGASSGQEQRALGDADYVGLVGPRA